MSGPARRFLPSRLLRLGQNASVSEIIGTSLRAAVAATLLLSAAACARPTGDFGRPQPGVLHDTIMPAIGKTRAQISGEPVSRFNVADEEREMHDRVWRFLVAPHARDWFYDTAVELQRTRVSGPTDVKFSPDRYYRWLRQADYRSSAVRYRTVGDHVQADLDTMPATFRAICAVLELDRQRQVASADLGHLQAADVRARKLENDSTIQWFVRAARYRYDSYAFALDHLLVETPHRNAIALDGRLSALAIDVERAERGDFCSGHQAGSRNGAVALPSRVQMQAVDIGKYRK